VTMYFPPSGGGGVARPTKLATHLPELGIETHVLAPDDSKWLYRDEEAAIPPKAHVHRAKYVGPRGRLPAEELHGLEGIDRLLRQAALFSRRLLVPDEFVSWALTAIPAARRIVLDEDIDVLVTTSPPASLNLIGAAVTQATGVPWVADLRDSVAANPDRNVDKLAVRLKEQAQALVARLVASHADAVVTVSDAISAEMLELDAKRVETIPNGCDFDDFEGLEYHRGDRFRITHTGTFFGHRDPRRAALELQRDSEALLLLLPDAGGRGRTVPSGKIFEYLAAERPILAAVPPDGVAAELVRSADAGIVVAPDDVPALTAAIQGLRTRWERGALENGSLAPELKERLSRRTRSQEFAKVLEEVAE